MRNIIIIIVIILAIGGFTYVRMSSTERESTSNAGPQGTTEESTTPEEPPTEPSGTTNELEGGTVEIQEEPDPDYFPEEEGEEEEEIPTEVPWSPDPEWWKKRQTPMFSNLATVMVTGAPYPTGEYTEERYLEIIDQMGVTMMSWFDYMWKPVNNDEWTEYIDLMHDLGIIVVGTDSMITTWKTGPEIPEYDASLCLDPYGNKWTSNYGLSGTIGDESQWYVHTLINPDWQEYLLDGIKRNIDAGVDGYLVDELCYSAVLEPDFSDYSMIQI